MDVGNYAAGITSNALLTANQAKLEALGKVSPQKREAIENASQEFEAIFINQMLQHMSAGIETNELFGGGYAEEMWQQSLYEEYATLMSRSGGVGIAQHVQRTLLANQVVE